MCGRKVCILTIRIIQSAVDVEWSAVFNFFLSLALVILSFGWINSRSTWAHAFFFNKNFIVLTEKRIRIKCLCNFWFFSWCKFLQAVSIRKCERNSLYKCEQICETHKKLKRKKNKTIIYWNNKPKDQNIYTQLSDWLQALLFIKRAVYICVCVFKLLVIC